MALSFSIVRRDTVGGSALRIVDITLDNSYPSPGGWAVTPGNVGFGANGQILDADDALKDGYLLQWDGANSKLKVHQGDNTNAAAAPAVELGNGSAVMNGKVVRMAFTGLGHG